MPLDTTDTIGSRAHGEGVLVFAARPGTPRRPSVAREIVDGLVAVIATFETELRRRGVTLGHR